MMVEVGAKIAGDRLADFDRRKADRTRPEQVRAERRGRDPAGFLAVEKRLDLAIPFHAVGKAGPAGAFSLAEYRAEQGKKPGRLDQQPVVFLRELPGVE